jgi:SAM-dependent methyltransferase
MQFKKLLFIAALTCLLPFHTMSQNEVEKPVFVPEEGIDGKDVIWWPTPNSLVKAMLDKANVGPADFVVDLGSGDGRIVIEAAKRGAHATGIEFNPDLVRLSEHRATTEGVSDKAKFLNMDLFEYDLSKATVITMYLLTDLNLKLRPKLLELKPGTRLVSNTFDLGDWQADEEISVESMREDPDGLYRSYHSRSLGYFWIVPAKVQGSWKFRDGKLNLEQKYQMVGGTFQNGTTTLAIEDGRLYGKEITFSINGLTYKGVVENNRMRGVYPDGNSEHKWEATR